MTILLLHDRPSPEWVARELAAGRCDEWRRDADEASLRALRDVLEAEHRDHQAVTR